MLAGVVLRRISGRRWTVPSPATRRIDEHAIEVCAQPPAAARQVYRASSQLGAGKPKALHLPSQLLELLFVEIDSANQATGLHTLEQQGRFASMSGTQVCNLVTGFGVKRPGHALGTFLLHGEGPLVVSGQRPGITTSP